MLAGAVYLFFCVAPTFWANYHVIMRECMNWVSVTAFISASPAADNYRVEQLWAKVVSPRIAQRQATNSTLLFCRHAMLVPSIVAPRTVRATIGDRAFPAAAASVWSSLPETLRASPSLPVFRRRLKTELFVQSYCCSASWTSVLTTTSPHITVTCSCSPRTLCHVKSIRYHHHHHHNCDQELVHD